jgi:hypothetical protein
MLHGIARRTEIRDFVWFLVYVGLGEKEPFATYLADYLQRNTTTLWEREGLTAATFAGFFRSGFGSFRKSTYD